MEKRIREEFYHVMYPRRRETNSESVLLDPNGKLIRCKPCV